MNEKFSLQQELLYSTQGAEANDVIEVKVDYLAIPLMVKYHLSEKFSVEAEPQASFLVNEKVEFKNVSQN